MDQPEDRASAPPDDLQPLNAAYMAEQVERLRTDPVSFTPELRRELERWTPASDASAVDTAGAVDFGTVVAAANLAESIRRYGHLAARLDPLGSDPDGDPSLSPEAHGISHEDLRRLPASLVGGPVAQRASDALEAIERLREVYCSTTGFDLSHVFVPVEREWLREAIESQRFLPVLDATQSEALLERLTEVEVFERFLDRAFPGKTRFSIEGLDLLVPMLDEILCDSAEHDVHHAVLGMAHRGRLNVLAHVLDKPYAQILAEFSDPVLKSTAVAELGWTGDVKYHAGARTTAPSGSMSVTMAPNPSHLEFVDPVVEGMARAAGTDTSRAGAPLFNKRHTLPILIHGDAAFPGQGIVAETLNLSRLSGYTTGGTIHIIANNQLGFTATPDESYSTSYASGLARGFKIPIVHVNADDPVACLGAAQLACAYRAQFGLDVLVDLVGYRRHGHNEGDEPAFTQPTLYEKIASHRTVRELFAAQLMKEGTISSNRASELVQQHTTELESIMAALEPSKDYVMPLPPRTERGLAGRVETAIPLERLRTLHRALLERPAGFTIHRKLERAIERRKSILEDPAAASVDWAVAEELAMAAILADGTPIRFTGQDVERGTFSHRHAVLHDAVNGARHVPLQSFSDARASFEIHNSPLSENAIVAFEFGYNVQTENCLVIWEAQYGDFINGAQVVLDQFVTSARAKWGQTPSLVFLLPHGYEGQGPEHSNARPERLLQAAADVNLRVVNCTTAAQYFHVLRRQAALLERDPLPLFILTPKSLLRHPASRSAPQALTDGRFHPVLDDEERASDDVDRLVLCSGKLYVDLIGSEQRAAATRVALVRLEQLCPFPREPLARLLARRPSVKQIVWAQEEPENMGAWTFLRPHLEEVIAGRCSLEYVGRVRSSSPSEGSSAWHKVHQQTIVSRAFDLAPVPEPSSNSRD